MKKVSLLICIFLFSCKSLNKNIITEKNQVQKEEENYVYIFKESVLFNCLRCSYGDSLIKIISKKELFNSYDDFNLHLESYKNSKKIAFEHCKKIDEVEYKFDDYKEGQNYYLSHCLKLYNSKYLDSIAKSEYREKGTVSY